MDINKMQACEKIAFYTRRVKQIFVRFYKIYLINFFYGNQ